MQVTVATTDEAETLAQFVNGAYRGPGAARGWAHEAGLLEGQRTDPAMIREMIEGGTAILLGREEPGGALLGCVAVTPPHEAGGPWHIGMVTVDPALQGGGLGRRLLDMAEDRVRSSGGRRASMTVIDVRDALIAWYERRGYRRTGATEPFPAGDPRFGVPLRPDLRFAVLDKAL